ncbi:MAG TPA: hypothetical protein VLA99_10780 [Nitrospiraceae bacterium]|nr:hypothetical protein [Nitrospiraceae bacterium]
MIKPWAIIQGLWQRFWRRRATRAARTSQYACVVWGHALWRVS